MVWTASPEDGPPAVNRMVPWRWCPPGPALLWLEGGAFRELAGMVTDPVCGMAVEPAGNPDATLDGRTWWFCSTHCRDEFTADPATFTGRQDEPTDAASQGKPGPSALAHTAHTADDEGDACSRTVR